MKVTKRVQRLEMKLSRDAESQAACRRLQEELTEFLDALRAWARQNPPPQSAGDAGASERTISQGVESQGWSQLLQQAITEYLQALRAWARQNQQPQMLIDADAFKPDGGQCSTIAPHIETGELLQQRASIGGATAQRR
jgi:hypothetical protein